MPSQSFWSVIMDFILASRFVQNFTLQRSFQAVGTPIPVRFLSIATTALDHIQPVAETFVFKLPDSSLCSHASTTCYFEEGSKSHVTFTSTLSMYIFSITTHQILYNPAFQADFNTLLSLHKLNIVLAVSLAFSWAFHWFLRGSRSTQYPTQS